MSSAPDGRRPIRVMCPSAEATRALAARMGRMATRGTVLALEGELGAGKTCFVQGLAEGLEVSGPVTSPTFVLVGEHRGRLTLYHVDLYRLESPTAVRALGLEEMLDGDGVTAIEWAERAAGLLPKRTIWVRLAGVGDEPRVIEIEGAPPGWVDPA